MARDSAGRIERAIDSGSKTLRSLQCEHRSSCRMDESSRRRLLVKFCAVMQVETRLLLKMRLYARHQSMFKSTCLPCLVKASATGRAVAFRSVRFFACCAARRQIRSLSRKRLLKSDEIQMESNATGEVVERPLTRRNPFKLLMKTLHIAMCRISMYASSPVCRHQECRESDAIQLIMRDNCETGDDARVVLG